MAQLIIFLLLASCVASSTTIVPPKTTSIAKATTATKTSTRTTTKSKTSSSRTPSTLIGPLTTIFTPPPSCFSITAIYTQTTFLSGILPNLDLRLPNSQARNCFPSYTALVPFVNKTPVPYFSPALCPSGYSTAVSSISKSEMLGICCPTGYSAVFDSCRSSITGGVTVGAAITMGVAGSEVTNGAFVVGNGEVSAEAVRVRYKSRDFPGREFKSQRKGLVGGVLGGVIVGGIFGGILLILGGYLLVRMVFRRRNRGMGGKNGLEGGKGKFELGKLLGMGKEGREGKEGGKEKSGWSKLVGKVKKGKREGKKEKGYKEGAFVEQRHSEESREEGRGSSSKRPSVDGAAEARDSSSTRSSVDGGVRETRSSSRRSSVDVSNIDVPEIVAAIVENAGSDSD